MPRAGAEGLSGGGWAVPVAPMSLEAPPSGRTADEPPGELRWSWGLLGLTAMAWTIMALAFFVSARTEGATFPWVSDAIWRILANGLWFAFTPAIFFLAKAFPVSGDRPAGHVAIHVLAAIAFTIAHMLIFLQADRWLDPYFPARLRSVSSALAEQWPSRLVSGCINYAVVFLVFSSIDRGRRARLERYRAEELRRRLAEAQLSALRMQIQPHFLFNTLHSISSLIHEAPSQAMTMVSRLGDFLRAALERGSQQTLRFEDELRFTGLYLDIERVRFGDRLRVSVEATPEALAAETPTLILQPLVENAIRHGVAPAMGIVDLQISATVRNGELEVRLRNAERHPDPARARPRGADGLGLANTRARLRHAYGEQASLTVEAPAPGAFQATVRLPVHEARHVPA
ncbi:MAG: sensor histidine kinase [Phenylobacterium sp.]